MSARLSLAKSAKVRIYECWPRWMDRQTAARYLDYNSVEIIWKFERDGFIVGRNPTGGKRFDRLELDRAFEGAAETAS